MIRTEEKKKEGAKPLSKGEIEIFFGLLSACRENALDLLEEAQILHNNERYARAYALSYTANEEVSKGQIVADFITGLVSRKELNNAFKDHKTKHAFTRIVIDPGSIVDTGQKWQHEGVEFPVFTQDDTLVIDHSGSDTSLTSRNRAMYVDRDASYKPIKPKNSISGHDSLSMIAQVKQRIENIQAAEDFNAPYIGTKALVK